MNEKIDCAVIGAGGASLAIARCMVPDGREVMLLDAEAAFGTRTSARNSGLTSSLSIADHVAERLS